MTRTDTKVNTGNLYKLYKKKLDNIKKPENYIL